MKDAKSTMKKIAVKDVKISGHYKMSDSGEVVKVEQECDNGFFKHDIANIIALLGEAERLVGRAQGKASTIKDMKNKTEAGVMLSTVMEKINEAKKIIKYNMEKF